MKRLIKIKPDISVGNATIAENGSQVVLKFDIASKSIEVIDKDGSTIWNGSLNNFAANLRASAYDWSGNEWEKK